MRRLLVTFSGLLAGSFFLLTGIGLLGTLVPLRLDAGGASSLAIGLVGGAYFVGLIVGTRYGDRVIGAVGHIRAFAAFASILSATILAFPIDVAAVPWAALRFICGFCLAGLFMCVESWLNAQASNDSRGRILSLYMIAVYLGQGAGQMLLPLPDPSGITRFAVCAAFISLAVVPVAVTRVAAPPVVAAETLGLARLYEMSPLGVAGAFVAGLVLGAFYVLGPIFARALDPDVTQTARFMGLVIVGGLILQWPVGRLSDRFDRRHVLVSLALCLVAVSIGFVLAERAVPFALLYLAPVFGAVIFTLYPLSVAHANDRLDSGHVVAASGALITVYGLGAAAGPPAASLAMEAVGPGGLFAFTALVGAATAAFALWRMRQRAPVPTSEQVQFLPLPRTTPLAGQLDPRGEGEASVLPDNDASSDDALDRAPTAPEASP